MKTIRKENYIILRDEKEDVKNFAVFLQSVYDQFENDNLVIDMLKYEDLRLDDLLEFLPLSNRHRKKKGSFIIVNDSMEVDLVPEELIVVPTLPEAEDVIQMEDIERDLGF